MHISGANMIELQNEQLANCLSFDEETFNYPPGGKGPLLSKANLSLLATSLSQRPVCLRLPPLPSSSLPAYCHPGYQQFLAPKTTSTLSQVQTVFCLLSVAQRSGPSGKDERRSAASLSGKGSSRSISSDFVLSWSLYSLSPQRPPLDWTGGSLSLSCPVSAPV